MIKKIIYYIRIICCILYLIMTLFMLKYIFLSKLAGIFFIIVFILFISAILWSLLSQKGCYQEFISYNLIIIALTLYMGVISSRLLLDDKLFYNSLYTVNIEYCKVNFIVLSFVMIGIILNTFFLSLIEQKKKR